eukprot:CAMPEP_0178598232 /NCGR_PEP_ID=MMETSP0697-20121206/32627_1 /TAXON_ID=265572 /ORGANISM="Extubocellulus spinifer, Strain CCMP396" /LENGTH=37 /DNA_ID= /DNA_START= /DNA_END= /DNA_ORIENTATION=
MIAANGISSRTLMGIPLSPLATVAATEQNKKAGWNML